MTALTANITDSQTLIPVDAGLTNGTFQYPLYFTIGDEAIRVTGRVHETTWLVDRGVAGTTAASHSDDAALTRYYPDSAASTGGEQTIRLLGPYTVNFDDPGIDDYAEVGEVIAAGTLIVSAWVVITTGLVSNPAGDGHSIYVSLGQDTGGMLAAYASVASSDVTIGEPIWINNDGTGIGGKRIGMVPSGGRHLNISMYPGQGVFTAGVVDVYALIAEPAA